METKSPGSDQKITMLDWPRPSPSPPSSPLLLLKCVAVTARFICQTSARRDQKFGFGAAALPAAAITAAASLSDCMIRGRQRTCGQQSLPRLTQSASNTAKRVGLTASRHQAVINQTVSSVGGDEFSAWKPDPDRGRYRRHLYRYRAADGCRPDPPEQGVLD